MTERLTTEELDHLVTTSNTLEDWWHYHVLPHKHGPWSEAVVTIPGVRKEALLNLGPNTSPYIKAQLASWKLAANAREIAEELLELRKEKYARTR